MARYRKFIGIGKDGMQYRFSVRGNVGMFTGEFSHYVIVECKNPKHHKAYETISKDYVHACDDAYDAACYFAGKIGTQIDYLYYANGRNVW